jgi:hypothetical protein
VDRLPQVGDIWLYGGEDHYLILAISGGYCDLLMLEGSKLCEHYNIMLFKPDEKWFTPWEFLA